jgi:hypothetical protein
MKAYQNERYLEEGKQWLCCPLVTIVAVPEREGGVCVRHYPSLRPSPPSDIQNDVIWPLISNPQNPTMAKTKGVKQTKSIEELSKKRKGGGSSTPKKKNPKKDVDEEDENSKKLAWLQYFMLKYLSTRRVCICQL